MIDLTDKLTRVMRLSRESEYGLAGISVLARQPVGTVMLLEEIAEAGNVPARFLAQIFQKLRRHNIVVSHRGAIRGYSLARDPKAINLREIFEAIEGPDLLERCIFWPTRCGGQHPCQLHERWGPVRLEIREMMERTSLKDVASGSDRHPGPGKIEGNRAGTLGREIPLTSRR